MLPTIDRGLKRFGIFVQCAVLLMVPAASVQARDHFLVLAGGYNPGKNQASLEANVLFFRQVLDEQHVGSRTMSTYFADGDDAKADLQYSLEVGPSSKPATALLTSLVSFRSPSNTRLRYRNHRVDNIAGPLSPKLVEDELSRLASQLHPGDRLFVYVTAHGAKAKGDNPYNTTISCWDRQSIAVKDFENWLDQLPAEVPVVMVMAQCYCGGFAHVLFNNGRSSDGISPHRRVGFFAQQHDLAAAGCRPDIRNDEEYSSYFWGAITGRTRSGKPTQDVDLDADGQVSLVEAHAYAMLASKTIDIPIRTSETLLRTYSRIGNYELRRPTKENQSDESDMESDQQIATAKSNDGGSIKQDQYVVRKPIMLAEMAGTLAALADRGTRDQSAIILCLADQLELELTAEASQVLEKFAAELAASPARGRSGRRGGSRRSIRRELLKQIGDEFPELADRENWKNAEALQPENQQATFERLTAIEGFERYQELMRAREQSAEQRKKQEMREVKFQRLINTLETVVLAENLPLLASPEIVDHYQVVLELENSTLN